jgi:hypothetical protein
METLSNIVVCQPSTTVVPPHPTTSIPPVIPSSSTPVVSSSSPMSNGNLSATPQVSGLNSNDVQAQLMLALTESFSKMTTIMTERSSDTKSDWPKFSGDAKKFKS